MKKHFCTVEKEKGETTEQQGTSAQEATGSTTSSVIVIDKETNTTAKGEKAKDPADRFNIAERVAAKCKATTIAASVVTSHVGRMIDNFEDRHKEAAIAKAARLAEKEAGVPKASQSVPAKAAPKTLPYKAPPLILESPPSRRREATRSPRPEGRARTTSQNATARRRVSWSPNALGERAVDSGGQRPPEKGLRTVATERRVKDHLKKSKIQ